MQLHTDYPQIILESVQLHICQGSHGILLPVSAWQIALLELATATCMSLYRFCIRVSGMLPSHAALPRARKPKYTLPVLILISGVSHPQNAHCLQTTFVAPDVDICHVV